LLNIPHTTYYYQRNYYRPYYQHYYRRYWY